MRTSPRSRVKQESGFGKGSLMAFSAHDSRISGSPPSTANAPLSRISSSNLAGLTTSSPSSRFSSEAVSEIAPEIVVWTEDMELDDLSPEEAEPLPASNHDTPMAEDSPPSDALHVQPPDASHESFESPMTNLSDQEQSELSSVPPSVSSKATTPVDLDGHKEPSVPSTETPPIRESVRRSFDVKPKSSIPANVPSYNYARQCIEAAESSRLNPFALHQEEYHMLRQHISHAQVTTYLNIRNSILRLWYSNPRVALARNEAVGCANVRWFDVASVCYDWLVRRGYINFGCVQFPATSGQDNQEAKTSNVVKPRRIVVIGAGMSGLGCARHMEGLIRQYSDRFQALGEPTPEVVVLEGRGRIGGRVYSREFKSKPTSPMPDFVGKRCTAEMGGMIITGFGRGNPMNVLVRGQLCLPYRPLRAETTIYDSNGKPVDYARDQLVENLYNHCLERVSAYKFKTQPSKLIEGNKDLINEGRDAVSDGHRTIHQAEEAFAALPHAPPVSQQNVPERVNLVPVSSDKLTGRVHTQPGTPGALKTAAEKAKEMGWSLKGGTANDANIDLTEAANLPEATLGSVLDEAVVQYRNIVDLTAQDHRLLNWHVANLEYSNATNLHKLSLGGWDIDAGNEWEGKHTMIVGGYQSVARGLLHCPTSLDVRTKSAVKKITYETQENGRASVQCEDGTTIEADYVVSTIPLGVLKQGNVEFDPPLPDWKTDAISRIGYGVLNKLVLVYDHPFWDTERHIFGVLRDAPNRHSLNQKDYGSRRGRMFQWFNVTQTTGLPCLVALMAGDAGFDTQYNSNDSLIDEATGVLRSVFGSKVPYPVESVVTRWAADKFARGSYSSAGPDMHPDDYDTMSRPIGNLFFAGEHTIGTYPATVHGAYLSGVRAASEVLDSMLGPIHVPTPLVLPKESVSSKRKEMEGPKDPEQAHLEAYELAAWEHVKSKIGERPARPAKLASNAYLLYSKAFFEVARQRCEEERAGRKKPVPNEVRVMTSKMWKAATPEERKPFEDQAIEQKAAYAEAVTAFNESSARWDEEYVEVLAAYQKDHPYIQLGESKADGAGKRENSANKHRRTKHVSYAESDGSDVEF